MCDCYTGKSLDRDDVLFVFECLGSEYDLTALHRGGWLNDLHYMASIIQSYSRIIFSLGYIFGLIEM
jgi:hypothetical protein